MNFENPLPGYPFEGDYPGFYEPVPGSSRATRNAQIEDLAGRHQDPKRRRAILEGLQALRERTRHPRVECVFQVDRPDVLYAPNEIVTSVAAYLDPMIRLKLEHFGFAPPDRLGVPGLPQVMRLASSGQRGTGLVGVQGAKPPATPAGGPAGGLEGLLEAIAFLRTEGHPASLNYSLTLAQDGVFAVGKAVGDPVAAPSLAPFPAYAANFPPAAHRTVVHVIDGGVPAHIRTDHWLENVSRTGANIDPLDVAPTDGRIDTMAGHGTRIAGIIAQVAPYAEIRMTRVMDTLGFASDTEIASAMLDAANSGAQVINISAAGAVLPDFPLLATGAAVTQILRQYGDQITIVAAAGNFGNEEYTYPAGHPGVVSVGGLTAKLTPTDWSTRGWVTFSTVGEWVRSTHVSEEYLKDAATEVRSEPWAASTGTSFAAPQIAGAIARICYERGLSPGAAVAELKRAALPVPGFGMAVQVLPGMP